MAKGRSSSGGKNGGKGADKGKMTGADAARIQAAGNKSGKGGKQSFGSRAQRAAARNGA